MAAEEEDGQEGPSDQEESDEDGDVPQRASKRMKTMPALDEEEEAIANDFNPIQQPESEEEPERRTTDDDSERESENDEMREDSGGGVEQEEEINDELRDNEVCFFFSLQHRFTEDYFYFYLDVGGRCRR